MQPLTNAINPAPLGVAPAMPRPSARPILKWAGGKTRLLSQLRPLLPPGVRQRRYFEPFAGGLGLFFHLAPQRAWIGDVNSDLMVTYAVVRNDLAALEGYLASLELTHSAERYYELRKAYNARLPRPAVERAALFIYLNRTCFNGLYRVNGQGEFNVPLGRYTRPRIHDSEALHRASRQLSQAKLRCGDFNDTLIHAKRGDFVYLDPPYFVPEKEERFTRYNLQDFTHADHERLAEAYRELDRRGCLLMLSNSATDTIYRLYHEYHCFEVSAPRSIGAKASSRSNTRELVICNYPPARLETSAGPVRRTR